MRPRLGFVPAETADLDHEYQVTDGAETSTSVPTCSFTHLVMYLRIIPKIILKSSAIKKGQVLAAWPLCAAINSDIKNLVRIGVCSLVFGLHRISPHCC